MNINCGEFNKKIEIIEYQLVKDEDGFETKTESILLKTWAKVGDVSGKEILNSDSDFAEVKTRFLMRTPKIKLDKDMVIKFKNKIYEIVYINDYNYDQRYTEIMAILVTK